MAGAERKRVVAEAAGEIIAAVAAVDRIVAEAADEEVRDRGPVQRFRTGRSDLDRHCDILPRGCISPVLIAAMAEVNRCQVAPAGGVWQGARMCFSISITGTLLPLWRRTAYDEVMLHCARVGYKP